LAVPAIAVDHVRLAAELAAIEESVSALTRKCRAAPAGKGVTRALDALRRAIAKNPNV
jgi:hypothetical protein